MTAWRCCFVFTKFSVLLRGLLHHIFYLLAAPLYFLYLCQPTGSLVWDFKRLPSCTWQLSSGSISVGPDIDLRSLLPNCCNHNLIVRYNFCYCLKKKTKHNAVTNKSDWTAFKCKPQNPNGEIFHSVSTYSLPCCRQNGGKIERTKNYNLLRSIFIDVQKCSSGGAVRRSPRAQQAICTF